MNPTTPTSAMSQGATFMRPGAMAWGHPGRVSQPPADPATPVTLDDPASQDAHQEILDAVQRAVAAVPELRFPIDVTFPGENEPDQVDAWISAYAEPFYIRA
jgi:hypothetical protein